MPHLSELPEWAKPKEVAAALGVTRRTINNWLSLAEDPLPGVRAGRRRTWLIPRQELEEWCRRRSNFLTEQTNTD